MDRIEFLVEEPSIAEVLKKILPQILTAPWHLDENYFIRPHEGKSDLMRSIPRKLKGFGAQRNQVTGFVIVQDQDSNDCKKLKQELLNLCATNSSGNIRYLVRIVCHELEAWYLGDMRALENVFPKFKAKNHKGKAMFRVPDDCVNPKAKLKLLLEDYPQIATAAAMAKNMDIEHNQSESFQQFIAGVKRFARQ